MRFHLRRGPPAVRIPYRHAVRNGEKECYLYEGSLASLIASALSAAPCPPLDSWKEIATYVKRDVSTVQRWEKREGMPVHRHLHDKRGSVYALGSELDAWLQSRGLRLEEEEKERRAETPVDAEGDRGPRGTPRASRWLLLGGVAVLAMLAVTYIVRRSPAADATQPKISSLVVLPLKDLSGEPDQQYFVEGLTDELTADLARLGSLRVISRTSAMLYTDTHKPLSQIGKELNVDAVVTGTIERSNNRVRIHTNLIRTPTGEILWAESYDRDLDDALRLESEVSQAIAHEVGIKLTPQCSAGWNTKRQRIPRPAMPISEPFTSSKKTIKTAQPSVCNTSRRPLPRTQVMRQPTPAFLAAIALHITLTCSPGLKQIRR